MNKRETIVLRHTRMYNKLPDLRTGAIVTAIVNCHSHRYDPHLHPKPSSIINPAEMNINHIDRLTEKRREGKEEEKKKTGVM